MIFVKLFDYFLNYFSAILCKYFIQYLLSIFSEDIYALDVSFPGDVRLHHDDDAAREVVVYIGECGGLPRTFYGKNKNIFVDNTV